MTIPRPTPAELRQSRQEARLTQTAAALLLGVSRSTWARWESPAGEIPAPAWIAWCALQRSAAAIAAAALAREHRSAAARRRIARLREPEVILVDTQPRRVSRAPSERPGHELGDWLAQREGKPAAGMIDGLSDETF